MAETKAPPRMSKTCSAVFFAFSISIFSAVLAIAGESPRGNLFPVHSRTNHSQSGSHLHCNNLSDVAKGSHSLARQKIGNANLFLSKMLQLLDNEAPGPAVTEFLIVGDRRAALFPDAGRFQLKGGLPPIEQVAMISPAILEGLL